MATTTRTHSARSDGTRPSPSQRGHNLVTTATRGAACSTRNSALCLSLSLSLSQLRPAGESDDDDGHTAARWLGGDNHHSGVEWRTRGRAAPGQAWPGPAWTGWLRRARAGAGGRGWTHRHSTAASPAAAAKLESLEGRESPTARDQTVRGAPGGACSAYARVT